MIPPALRYAVGALAALGLVAVPAAPAAAAETGAALISVDGSSFSKSPEGSIFPVGVVLVPGSTATGTFFVKNDSDRAADLQVSVAGKNSGATLMDVLWLQAATPATENPAAVPMSTDSDCIPLLSGEVLDSQEVTAVQITLALEAATGNADQGGAADARLVVSLTEPGAPDSGMLGCADGGGIPLTPSPEPAPAPVADRPLSETTDPTPALPAEGPSTDGGPDDDSPKTGAATPAAETPPTAGALPPLGTHSSVPLPLLGTCALLIGAAAFLLTRYRRRQRR